MIEAATQLQLTLSVIPHVVSEFVYVMTRVYGQSASDTARYVDTILDTPGFDYLDFQPIRLVTEWWPTRVVEYGDAVLAATAHASGYAVLTFDRALARRLRRHGVGCERLAA